MITNGHGIIPHSIHEFHLHLTHKESIVWRTLREVSTIKEQQLRVFFSLLLHHGYSSEKSSSSCLECIIEVVAERHYGAMRVVGMQYGQRFLR